MWIQQNVYTLPADSRVIYHCILLYSNGQLQTFSFTTLLHVYILESILYLSYLQVKKFIDDEILFTLIGRKTYATIINNVNLILKKKKIIEENISLLL